MITEAIVGIPLGIVEGIIAGLPHDHLVVPSFGPMVGLAMQLDGFLPVHEVIDFSLTALGVTIVIFGFRLLMYLYSLIPFKFS